jgi:putative two-component system response regulator
MARDIALSHHERYDGCGYPRGLAGEAIPLAARIMALADVYDALISRRVYKEAYRHDKTRWMIVGEAGSHFDPAVVEAFVAEEKQFVAICTQFAEPGAEAMGDEKPEMAGANRGDG